MNMANKERWKIIGSGALGVGIGACSGELVGETAARVSGQTGWLKVGVKAAVKALIFGVFTVESNKTSGVVSLITEIAGYGSLGSIFNDIFYAAFPGGIWGLAGQMAMSITGYSRAGVTSTVSRVEAQAPIPVEQGSGVL